MVEITFEKYKGPRQPFQGAAGPRNAKLAIVGEAWGKDEDNVQAPFIGTSGQELTRLLEETGIKRWQCFLTNILAFRPTNNDLETLCVNKATAGTMYSMPPLKQGKYLHPMFLPELERVKEELQAVRPNLVLAMGNMAIWGLLYRTGISTIRGSISPCQLVPGLKVLPTFHPSAVLRNWSLRPVVSADLIKAKREMAFPELRLPKRTVLVEPSLADIRAWISKGASILGCDIETANKQITMIGFARSPSDALVIPFVDSSKPQNSYWPSLADELAAWHIVRDLLESDIPKVFQNGLYDLQYLYRMGIRPRACKDDTMLLHHALFPELQKGLGFLGSIYTNEQSWKLMRHHETTKRDE